MADPVRMGIAGCGEIGVATAKAIADAPSSRLVHVMDIREELAQDLGESHGVRVSSEYQAVLDDPEVEAVYIATPHHLHASMAIEAARAGKHLLLEKPLATNMDDARRMIEVARECGVVFSVAFPLRYYPAVYRAREMVAAGAIGDVIALVMIYLYDKKDSYWEGGYSGRVHTDWRKNKDTSGGGVLLMNGSHNIDRIRFVTGLEAKHVYCGYNTYATDIEVEDFAFATYGLTNGGVASMVFSSAARGHGLRQDHIYGTDGQIELGTQPLRIFSKTGRCGLPAGEWVELSNEQDGFLTNRIGLVEDFCLAVRGEKETPVPAEDALKTLAWVLTAYDAGKQGTVLPIAT